MSGSEDEPEVSGVQAVVSNAWTTETWARIARLRVRLAAMRAAGRALIQRCLPNESQHLFALTLGVGVVCGLVAVAFHLAIRAAEHLLIDRALNAEGSAWMVWTVLSPTLGGLLAGAALTWIVPGARGSGIPQVKQAFATEGGRIRFRDAFGKFVIGALQIGSGASLGREGPTVQICAGAASLLARATWLPPRQMRRLTPVGVAAGIAAAFNAPIAAVTFTIEEIVGTLDHAVLSGVVIAAALAAVIERSILGAHPVIAVAQTYGLDHASSIPLFAVLGIAAAAVSVVFTDGLLKLRMFFRGLTIVPSWMHPGIGGLVTGLLAVGALRFLGMTGINGGGYETLGLALGGELGLRVLAALCLAKLVATVFSYSSGGAGGIFAPALFVGAMLGGAAGHLDVFLLGHESRQLGAFALVGMGAVFAGVIRAPITSVLIIFEMTGGYGLVLPLMLANMTSYLIARRLRPTPIYEALLAQDGIVLPHATPSTRPLEQVADAMTRDVLTLHPEQSIAEAITRVGTHTFARLPVVDSAGVVLGSVPLAELRKAPDATSSVTTVMQAGHLIRSDAPLLRAAGSMRDLGVRQLLVTDGQTESRLVGILAISDLVRATPSAPRTVELQRLGPFNDLRVRALMIPAAEVLAGARVRELAEQQRDGDAKAFVVRAGERQFGAILPEELRDFAKDEDLEKIVVAADLARPAPTVGDAADVATLVDVMRDDDTEAAVVIDATTSAPIGVVTKSALARAFFDWFASRPPAQRWPA